QPWVAHPLSAAADKGWVRLFRIHAPEPQTLLRQARLAFSYLHMLPAAAAAWLGPVAKRAREDSRRSARALRLCPRRLRRHAEPHPPPNQRTGERNAFDGDAGVQAEGLAPPASEKETR